jgi:hypothetical protein
VLTGPRLDDTANLLGYYDLTGRLSGQMPGLKPHKTIRNGYTYYSDIASN